MTRTSMGIRTRLMLVAMLPALAMLYYLASVSISSFRDMRQAELVTELAVIAVQASQLVHELQKERGMTAGFISSGGEKFADQIVGQRRLTDERRAILENELAILPSSWSDLDFLKAINRGVYSLGELAPVRSRVDAGEVQLSEALSYYTGLNASFLSSITSLKGLLPDSNLAPLVATYFNYAQMKERMGIERSVGSAAFAADRFNAALFSRFQTLLTLQSTFEELFLLSADEQTIAFYRETLAGPEVEEVKRLEAVAQTYDDKVSAGAELAPLIGYGGLIEEFKNFELGRGTAESERFREDFEAMHEAVERYKAIPYISAQDLADLEVLESTMMVYRDALNRVSQLLARGVHAEDIDAQVDIDDAPAVEALGRLVLGGSFGQDPERWFQLITVKINKVKQVEDFIADQLSESMSGLAASDTLHFWLTLIVGLIIQVITMTFAIRTANAVSTSIQGAVTSVEQVAEGDLSHELEVQGDDEIARLLGSINTMIGNLNAALGSASTTGRSIAAGAEDVSTSSSELSRGASDQAAALEQITSSMTEIDSQTQANAENASRANTLAAEVQEQANRGAESVTAMTQSMADIAESSAAIAQVTKLVDDIAFQTNLLALNASVEAARAGTEGRGFAVVAEEVRSLATRSSDAAREIQVMVETASGHVETGAQKVASAQRALDEILEGIHEVTRVFAEIASASSEQTMGISQVQTGLMELDRIAQQNAHVSDSTARISGSFVDLVESLQAELSRFQLKHESVHPETGRLPGLPPSD